MSIPKMQTDGKTDRQTNGFLVYLYSRFGEELDSSRELILAMLQYIKGSKVVGHLRIS